MEKRMCTHIQKVLYKYMQGKGDDRGKREGRRDGQREKEMERGGRSKTQPTSSTTLNISLRNELCL